MLLDPIHPSQLLRIRSELSSQTLIRVSSSFGFLRSVAAAASMDGYELDHFDSYKLWKALWWLGSCHEAEDEVRLRHRLTRLSMMQPLSLWFCRTMQYELSCART